MDMHDVLIVVNGQEIRVCDVLIYLKVNGTFRDTVCQLVELEAICSKSRERGITIGDEELHAFAAQKRRYLGLARAEAMAEYCRSNGITLEQWHGVTRHEALRQKVRDAVVTPDQIGAYYQANARMLQAVTLSRIVCADHAAALNLRERALTRAFSFADLAREHSIEQSTRMAGGYLGVLRRSLLPQKLNEALSSAKADDVLGPFLENNRWAIYCLHAVRSPELNEGMKKEIADRLFKAWLQKAINESRFERPK